MTPLGWRVASLGDLVSLVAGSTPKGLTEHLIDGPAPVGSVPFFKVGDMNLDPVYLRDARVSLSRDAAQRLNMRLVPEGAVVFPKAGGAIATNKKRVVAASGVIDLNCMAAVPGRDIDGRFLRLWFESIDLSRLSDGSVLPQLSKKTMANVPLLLPPIEEQVQIVEILEDHFSRLDAAERYLSGVLLKTDVAQGAVFQALLRSGDASQSGDVSSMAAERDRRCPAGMKRGRPTAAPAAAVEVPWAGRWPTVSLEESTEPVRTVSYGILKPGPDVEAGIPYVRVLNMRNDVLALDDLHRTSPEIAAQYSRASLEPDDVLVSIRGTFGRVVLVPPELRGGNITQDTARLAVLPQLLPDFVAFVLRSPWAQAHLRRAARGVAVKGVNIADLRRVPLPLPSLDIQARLVDQADQMTSDLQAAKRSAKVGQGRAAALRRALLSAAFSGRLTPQADGLEASGV